MSRALEERRRRSTPPRDLLYLLALLALAGALFACADEREGSDPQVPQIAPAEMPPEQQIADMIDILGNESLPPEMRAYAAKVLATFDPAQTTDALVAMLAAEEPLVLIGVIESLPHAAESLATPELERLGSSHAVPAVQAAARARLAEFEALHQMGEIGD